MAVAIASPRQGRMIVTLDAGTSVAKIKKVLMSIRGVASVRVATIGDNEGITPAIRRKMNKARREYANGETISCGTPEEMQRYFDSL